LESLGAYVDQKDLLGLIFSFLTLPDTEIPKSYRIMLYGSKGNGKIECRKQAGKIADINKEGLFDKMEGQFGVGHTRWATHGGVTKENAHPHVSCNKKIAIVVNGAYGERFVKIAQSYKIPCVPIEFEWGEELDLKKIEEVLKNDKSICCLAWYIMKQPPAIIENIR
jgi:hypothetical protein